jgi:hypothetical protein
VDAAGLDRDFSHNFLQKNPKCCYCERQSDIVSEAAPRANGSVGPEEKSGVVGGPEGKVTANH